MVRLTRRSATLLLAAVAGVVLVANWSARPSRGPLEASAAAPAGRAEVAGPGRLEPASGEVDLAADGPGVLASIPVKEGDRVSKGQILAELVNQDALSLVAQADATLRMQEARRAKLKKGARAEERRQAVALVQEQDATLRRVDRDLSRQKMLFARGYSSNAQLEQAQSAASVAIARKNSAADALAQIDAGPRVEDVAGADAEVSLARAQLQGAQAALEKTRIRAPTNGVVLRTYKHPGEAVGPGVSSAILQIGDIDNLVVRMQIDEADIAHVTRGTRAYVTAGAPAEKRDASVLDVLVKLDAGTHLPIGLRVDCYVPQAEGAT